MIRLIAKCMGTWVQELEALMHEENSRHPLAGLLISVTPQAHTMDLLRVDIQEKLNEYEFDEGDRFLFRH